MNIDSPDGMGIRRRSAIGVGYRPDLPPEFTQPKHSQVGSTTVGRFIAYPEALPVLHARVDIRRPPSKDWEKDLLAS